LVDEHERQIELVDLHRHHEKEREDEEPPPTLWPSASFNDLLGRQCRHSQVSSMRAFLW
jgi:hypothetical protein